MHILLIHQFFLQDNEGGGSRWNEMSRIWTEKGHKVTVLTGSVHYMNQRSDSNSGKYFVKKINKDRVKVISCFVSKSYTSGFFGRLWAYFSFSFSSIYGGIVYARDKYDLIIVTSPPLLIGLSAIVLSGIKQVPFLFEVRDLWPESAIDTGILKNKLMIRVAFWFEAYLYQKASMINVLTPAFRDILINQKNIPPEKIIYIPNASDFALADRINADFDIFSFREQYALTDKFVITYVGAHGIANHLMQIVNAATLLRDTNCYFLLIGNGEQKEALIAEATKRKLLNIQFIDPMPKREVLKFVLASDMGASVLKKTDIFKTIFSNKTFDYFSCKRPVLMAIDGISRQLIEEADAGIFIEPENAQDFADKVRYCLNNPDLLVRQGNHGYRYAKLYFDRDVLAQKYLDYLEDCFGKHRNGKGKQLVSFKKNL